MKRNTGVGDLFREVVFSGGGHLNIWVGMCRPIFLYPVLEFALKLIPRSRNGPIFYTPF